MPTKSPKQKSKYVPRKPTFKDADQLLSLAQRAYSATLARQELGLEDLAQEAHDDAMGCLDDFLAITVH